MLGWLVKHALVWSVRVAVLLGACWATDGLVNRELGYRMHFMPVFLLGLLTVVVVRVWMPWSKD